MQKQATEQGPWIDRIESLPGPVAAALAVTLALLVGWIDFLTGFEVSLSFFYLIPISLVAWARGKAEGLLLSILCAAISLRASMLSGHSYSNAFVPFWNTLVRLAIFLLVTILLSALRDHLRNEKKLARTDHLTGALNRRAFYEVVKTELERSRRYGRPFTVAYIDLDNFKEINDTFGHSIGDAVLRTVARTTMGNIRSVDICARLGGDEFALLLPETGSPEATSMLARLHRVITHELEKGQWGLTLSMGATIFLSCPKQVDDIIHMADHAMYKVKRGSKSAIQFTVYEDTISA